MLFPVIVGSRATGKVGAVEGISKKAVLSAKVPYIKLFGVDGMGKGRPGIGSRARAIAVPLDPPYEIEDPEEAKKIAGQARTRAITVLRFIHSHEYRMLYRKELAHLVEQHRRSVEEDAADEAAEAAWIERSEEQ